MQKLYMQLLAMVLSSILPSISASMQAALCEWVASLRATAAKTPNPFDDMLVSVLEHVFCTCNCLKSV